MRSTSHSSANRYEKMQKRLIELETERTKDMDFKARLWYILTRWDYVIYMFCMTCIFVVVTGI